MDTGRQSDGSTLFLVRVWPERVYDGEQAWRGRVQHVISGEAYSFADWLSLIYLINDMVPGMKPDEQLESGQPQT